MKKPSWPVMLGLALLAASAVFYLAHYLLFRDAHHILIYLVGDVAFLPVEILLVTLVVHRMLTRHEKQAMLHKLNMVIGAFQSEVGAQLMRTLQRFDGSAAEIAGRLCVTREWTARHYAQAHSTLGNYAPRIDPRAGDLVALRDFLQQRRDFLLRLLENPVLLEHEHFTDLLWAVFHLTEELAQRADLSHLTDTDATHLSGDIARAHKVLLREWLRYMGHMQKDYPYLFSLAVRTNPFDPAARVEVTA